MNISVVILSFNADKTIGRCLTQLVSALKPLDGQHEVFVVDNGSHDDSAQIIEDKRNQFGELIRPIFLHVNTGTTVSRNLALSQCAGDYILVLDSDAYVNYAALNELIAYLEANPTSGIAAPKLCYGNGEFQLSCDVFPTLWHKLKRFLLLKRMESSGNRFANLTEPEDVDYSISACWLIRREAFLATGLFDERIFYSPEDVDYCLRVWKAGYKVTFVPTASVVHDAQELSRGFRISKFHLAHFKGLVYLLVKHRYFWGRRRLYAAIDRAVGSRKTA